MELGFWLMKRGGAIFVVDGLLDFRALIELDSDVLCGVFAEATASVCAVDAVELGFTFS